MKWEVGVTGDNIDLALLSEALHGEQASIRNKGDTFVLESNDFDDLPDAKAVRKRAQQIVTVLSAYSRLKLDGRNPIQVGAITLFPDDGSQNIFLPPAAISAGCRLVPPNLSITRRNGTIDRCRPADSVQQWLALARQDESVAKVLRLRNEDGLSWGALYRIYEVIQGDVGKSEIVSSKWTSGRKISRFKRTANSVEAVGDHARHGCETDEPPTNPMTLSEAKRFIDSLIKSWVASKTPSC